jgi:hypothetical protein
MKIKKRMNILICDENDMTTVATIATRRTAHRDIFFASPCYGAIATFAGLCCDSGFINELH